MYNNILLTTFVEDTCLQVREILVKGVHIFHSLLSDCFLIYSVSIQSMDGNECSAYNALV